MELMARKSKPSDSEQDASVKRTTSIRLPAELLAIMDKIAEDRMTDRTNEFINACREFAEKYGYMKPKNKE